MSAMPSDEIAAGGNVVPLRTGPPPVDQSQPASELGPISPELAMIDPELAQAARELLPDFSRPAPVEPAVIEHPRRVLEPTPELAPPRRRRRLGLISSAAGVLALGVLLTLVVGREEPLAPRTLRTQSVAGAVVPERPAPASATTAAASTAPATAAPAHATSVPGETFVWAASPDASAYEFQLFQGGERVFRTRVGEARLELPGRWRQDGRPHALLPGSYRWYVWTISKTTNRQSTKPTVSAKLVVDDEPQ